jgi:hypothetical protein
MNSVIGFVVLELARHNGRIAALRRPGRIERVFVSTDDAGGDGNFTAFARTAHVDCVLVFLLSTADDNHLACAAATAASGKSLRTKAAEHGSQHENGKRLAEHDGFFFRVSHG